MGNCGILKPGFEMEQKFNYAEHSFNLFEYRLNETLVIGAPKHKGGTGGPARLFAMV